MNPDEPAFPRDLKFEAPGSIPIDLRHDGLTKREYFAAIAMQACIGLKPPIIIGNDHVPIETASVMIADALIAELSK